MAELTTEQYLYCDKKCPVGCNKRSLLLRECESALDAAYDMKQFVNRCSETCDIIKNWGTFKNANL